MPRMVSLEAEKAFRATMSKKEIDGMTTFAKALARAIHRFRAIPGDT